MHGMRIFSPNVGHARPKGIFPHKSSKKQKKQSRNQRMTPVLLTLAALAVFVGCIWAVGVALQGQQWDHEEIRRREAEWEEMGDE
jgi:hypothetical protein